MSNTKLVDVLGLACSTAMLHINHLPGQPCP